MIEITETFKLLKFLGKCNKEELQGIAEFCEKHEITIFQFWTVLNEFKKKMDEGINKCVKNAIIKIY